MFLHDVLFQLRDSYCFSTGFTLKWFGFIFRHGYCEISNCHQYWIGLWKKIDFCFYLIEMYNSMRIKCGKCSHIQEITIDKILFDDEDEKMFVSYLAAEMAKSEDTTE